MKTFLLMTAAMGALSIRAFDNPSDAKGAGLQDNPPEPVIPDADGVIVIDTPAGPTRINHGDFDHKKHKLFKANDRFDERGVMRSHEAARMSGALYDPQHPELSEVKQSDQQPQPLVSGIRSPANIPAPGTPQSTPPATAHLTAPQESNPSVGSNPAPLQTSDNGQGSQGDQGGNDDDDKLDDATITRIKAMNLGAIEQKKNKHLVVDGNNGGKPVDDLPGLIDAGGYRTNKAAWEAIMNLKKAAGVI